MKPLPLSQARRRFTAIRDENGVPHISAGSWLESLYGLGYLHALDRPTQMLFARAVASGRAAELIADKRELLETDRFFRRIGLYLHLAREVRALDDAIFSQLTVYCEGVSDGLREARRSLPMWATGFAPTPWNQESALLIGQLLSFGGLVIGQQENERLVLDLIHAGVDDDKLRELFHPLLNLADFELLRRIKFSSQLSDHALELIADLPRLAGSNAWAVAPARSATGGALLASDPHLEVNRLPAIWYEAVLKWPDNYVMGASLPGCPIFAVARTKSVGWGVTYLKGDTTDHFIEDCRPGGATGWQYRRGATWHDFDLRVETISRKSGPPESLRVLSNQQGTLLAEPTPAEGAAQTQAAGETHGAAGKLALNGPGLYLSSAWIGDRAGAGASIAAWLNVIGARSAVEAMDHARECPLPSLNWIFADRDGHIGQQANGWFPRRPRGVSGALPIPAWDTQFHWQGRLSAELLPRSFDPRSGFVATANEKVGPRGGPDLVTLAVPEYRKRRIDERLAALPKSTIADMQSLQYDVVSLQARDLLPVILPHLSEGPIKDQLSQWDGSYSLDSIEATLFSRLYANVLLEVFGQERGIGWRRMLYLCSRVGFSTMVLTCIDRLLQQGQSFWWHGRDKGLLIRRAEARTAALKPIPWRQANSFRFTNRFVEGGFVGRALRLNTGEMGMPGNYATPFQGHLLKAGQRVSTFAPSYHFVTDMSTDEAWTNLPGGPSESSVSGWYRTDIGRWHSGQYKRLTVDVEA